MDKPKPPYPLVPGLAVADPSFGAYRGRRATARHIEELIDEARITQQELSDLIGCEASTVCRHVTDESNPRLKTLREYHAVFFKLLNRKIVVRRNAIKRK